MVNPRLVSVDLDKMIVMEMPQNLTRKMMVTVNAEGTVTLSPKLMEQLKLKYPDMELELSRSEDARILVLRGADTYRFKIVKTGRFKYPEFCAKLREFGYQLPVRYSVDWNPGVVGWVGVLQELEPAPSVPEMVKKYGGQRRRTRKVRGDEA